MSDKLNERLHKASGAKDIESIRRTKKEESVNLRKQKREERLLEKRSTLQHSSDEIHTTAQKSKDIPLYAEKLRGNNIEELRFYSCQIRKSLSSAKIHPPPLSEIIETGILPRLVELMTYNDEVLQLECAWALTNIASGTNTETRCVVNANAIPVFIQLMRHSNVKISEQVTWALGNIMGDSSELRDLIINHGIVEILKENAIKYYESYIKSYEEDDKSKSTLDWLNVIRTFSWTMSNLCRGKNPTVNINAIYPLLPVFTKLLSVTDVPVVVDACWSWTFISDLDEGVDLILNNKIHERLISLLSSNLKDLIIPVIRTVGNILGGNEMQTQNMIDSGCIPFLHNLLKHQDSIIRKDACWALSNITAGTAFQVNIVFEANVIPDIVRLLKDNSKRVRKEAGILLHVSLISIQALAWVISNAVQYRGTTEAERYKLLDYLYELQTIEGLLYVLSEENDSKTTSMILLSFLTFLNLPNQRGNSGEINKYAQAIEENDGLKTIQLIAETYKNDKVSMYSNDILSYYASNASEEIDMIPEVVNDGYQFQSTQNNETYQF